MAYEDVFAARFRKMRNRGHLFPEMGLQGQYSFKAVVVRSRRLEETNGKYLFESMV